EGILLDANENSYGPAYQVEISEGANGSEDLHISSGNNDLNLHRYPDPLGRKVKDRILKLRPSVPSVENIFLGVGSDEVIDMLVRITCTPGKDSILITPPTYGMYRVVANINDVNVVKVPLIVEGGEFQLDVDAVIQVAVDDPTIKIIWLCSPGNPTGTYLREEDVRRVLDSAFEGLVVIDEAYVDFVRADKGESYARLVREYPQLLVMQTMSKSFGLAGIRLGVGIGSRELVSYLNNAKAPYNVSTLSLSVATAALSDDGLQKMRGVMRGIQKQRDEYLIPELKRLPHVGAILGGNDANFVVCRIVDSNGEASNEIAKSVYVEMAQNRGLVVRYRGTDFGCEGCLRITVGTAEENKVVIDTLRTLLDGKLKMSILDEHNFPFCVTAHAFNRDKTQVAVCPNSNEVHIYTRSGAVWTAAHVLREHDLLVTSIDWAPQTNRIVTCSQDKNAYVWTFDAAGAAWKPTLVHLRLQRAATQARWSPQENKFAVASGDKCVAVCYFGEDNDWWVSKHLKRPIASTVLCVAWHPNNVLLACGGTDMKARVLSAYIKGVDEKPAATAWGERLPFNTLCGEFESPAGGWVHSIAFSPDGDSVAFVTHDSSLTVASPATGSVVSVRSHGLPFVTLVWPDTRTIVAAGHDCAPVVFTADGTSWRAAKRLGEDEMLRRSAAASPSNSNSAFNMFRQMDSRSQPAKSGSGDGSLKSVHQNTISEMHLDPAGNTAEVTTIGLDGKLVQWSLRA
ncbi:histidinol-phosphate transaminase, partial [Coemansia sp. RSA 2523]